MSKNPQYKAKFEEFKSQIEENNLELVKPNYMNNKHRPIIISCAIKRKNSKWQSEKECKDYICSEWKGGRMFYNRAVELYNTNYDINLLGVHIPDAHSRPCASVMWDDIIYYYKKMSNKNLIVIGDLNVYEDGTIQKRKFKELISLGAYDVWVSMGKSPDEVTYKESRLDYVLASPTGYGLIQKIDIQDDKRMGKDAFTDHFPISVELLNRK